MAVIKGTPGNGNTADDLTGTDAADCDEVDGPESGVEFDYHCAQAAGTTAYIVHDHGRISISVTEAYGDEGGSLEFDLREGVTSGNAELRPDL